MNAAALREEPFDARHGISEFLSGFSVETTPGAARKIADYRSHLRPGTAVYITFLSGSDFRDTVDVAVRLRREGFEPVPHLAARSIPGRRYLEDGLKRLTAEAGVRQALVIAGALDQPIGTFENAMQILETGLLDANGITRIGVAGHPEGSPDISDDAISAALAWKNAFAERTSADMHVVTQFCFEAAPLIAWDKALQAEGNRLPVIVGVPGLATLKALIGHATACGIGPSMRVLTRQARNVAKLFTVSAPDRLIVDLAAYRSEDACCGITGIHMYPLGGLGKSARWAYAVADGRFSFDSDGRGLGVASD